MNESIIFKRKFRWTLESEGILKPTFVKANSSRPSMQIEEIELNFLADKFWVPGKCTQTSSFTVFDCSEDLSKLYSTYLESGKEPEEDKLVDFTLKLYDGCGNLMESWVLEKAYTKNFQWKEYDHSSTESTDIEFDVKYKSIKYISHANYQPEVSSVITCPKITCPNCKHEFENKTMGIGKLDTNNIIFK